MGFFVQMLAGSAWAVTEDAKNNVANFSLLAKVSRVESKQNKLET